jgi:hypothetical protein
VPTETHRYPSQNRDRRIKIEKRNCKGEIENPKRKEKKKVASLRVQMVSHSNTKADFS